MLVPTSLIPVPTSNPMPMMSPPLCLHYSCPHACPCAMLIPTSVLNAVSIHAVPLPCHLCPHSCANATPCPFCPPCCPHATSKPLLLSCLPMLPHAPSVPMPVPQQVAHTGADTPRARRPKVLLPLGLDEDLKSLSRCQPCHLKGDCRSRQLVGGQCCWFILQTKDMSKTH